MALPLPRSLLESAARRFGTPLYVYSAAAVRARIEEFNDAFASIPHLVCFALKANPNAAVSRLLAREGAGAEVVSGGELWRALRAGFSPRRLVFSGVGKTQEEMAAALRAGILMLNVESAEELDALERVSRRLDKKVPLSIRVNPDIDPRTHEHITTGRADNKFGVTPREAAAMYQRAQRSGRFECLGIHTHLGSQIATPGPFAKALDLLLGLTHDLKTLGVRLRFVDVGGGWRVPDDGRAPEPISRLAKTLIPRLKGKALTLILEPGRYLVAGAGVLLTRVLYRKQGAKKRFVIVDAAMNDLVRPALYGARHPVVSLDGRGAAKRVEVAGPVCESGDFLARGALLPWPDPGELLAVLNAGAYGFSMSSQYNSRPRAAEVLADGRILKLVRKRETYQDLVRQEP